MLWKPFYPCLEFHGLLYKISTFVVCGWVFVVKVTWIYIFAVLYVDLLVVIVADSKSFAIAWRASLLVELSHIVCIWRRLLFGVAQNYLWNRSTITFAESAWLILVGGPEARLQNIRVLDFAVLEAVIFWERVAVRSMSPCWWCLVPSRDVLV